MAGKKISERWYFHPFLLGMIFTAVFFRFWNHAVIFRDSFRLYAPYKFLIGEALRSGRLYAWNPWQYLGLPFVADIVAGWFYPLNLLYIILPFEPAHRLFILLHYPVAAVGMDLLLKEKGLSRPGRLFGSFLFALSGYLISQHTNLPFLIGPALAPYALWAMAKSEKAGWTWSAVSAAVLALQVLGGEPQSAAVTGFLLFCLGLGRVMREKRPARESAVLFFILVVSLLLSLVQILPTYELLKYSVRSGKLGLTEAGFFSFHPFRLVEFIWPNPFGNLFPTDTYWGRFTLDPSPLRIPYPWSLTNYVGLLGVIMAGWGVVKADRFRRWAFTGAIAFFLGLSLGRHLPLYGWLYHLFPPFGYFRYPSKYLAWVNLVTAWAAAYGLEEFRRGAERGEAGPRRLIAAYLLITLTGFVLSRLAGPWVITRLAAVSPASVEYETARQVIRETARQWLFVNLALGFIGFLWLRRKIADRLAAAGFFALFISDLWLANVTVMAAGPPEIFAFRPVAAQAISPTGRPPLGRFRILREELEFRDQDPALAPYPQLIRRCFWERNTLIGNLDNLEGFENFLGYNQAVIREGLSLLNHPRLRTLEIFNVAYVISAFGRKPVSPTAETIFQSSRHDLEIRRLRDAFPRAFRVPAAMTVKSEEEAMKLLAETDLRRTVILTTAQAFPPSGSAEERLVPAEIKRYEPDEVVIETTAAWPGWLVLSDRFYPGWCAEVDGRETAVFKANVLVRAVPVAAGRHEVRFRFQPLCLRAGAAVSGAAWLLLLGGGFLHFLRRGGVKDCERSSNRSGGVPGRNGRPEPPA